MFNLEDSKKAMEQFTTDDERAELFLEMTSNLFEAHKMRNDAENQLAEANKIINFMESEDWSTLDEGNVIKMLRDYKKKYARK